MISTVNLGMLVRVTESLIHAIVFDFARDRSIYRHLFHLYCLCFCRAAAKIEIRVLEQIRTIDDDGRE